MKQIIFISLLIGCQSGIAQTHQWAQFFRSCAGYTTAFSLSTDSKKNVYMVGEFTDSLFIDSQIIADVNTPKFRDGYLGKLNSKGKLLWCNVLNIYGTELSLRHVQTISDNKILVYGFFSGSKLKFTANDSLTDLTYTSGNPIFTGFVALYDSSGKFINALKTYIGQLYGSVGKGGHNFDNGEFTMDSKGYFYLKFYKDSVQGSINFKGGSIALNDTIARDILIKFSPSFDSVLWYKEFPKTESFQVTRIRAGDDDNIYMACHAGGANFILGGKAYRFQNYPDKGFLSVISPKGTFIHNSLINSDSTQKDNLYDIGAKDTNNIYIIGFVEDSIFYGNKWYASPNRKAQKSTYKNVFPYIGVVSLSKGAKWIKLPVVRAYLYTLNPHKAGRTIERLSFDKSGHIYAAFQIGDSIISIGGLSSKVTNGQYYAFVKMDKMGNALWIKPFSESIRDIVATPDSNLVFSGTFDSDEIFIDPFHFKKGSYSARIHAYIAKTDDYAIIREYVSPGPYCAGDTLDIPYYRYGKYDTSNYFIAELSDEKGNFDGRERELGRLKTTKNGTVKCNIPLFKVSSSFAYRIRIRSTSPTVQSFYKRDTLQLLIYSKDKANPGPTEIICKGDSIKLNTYGGTKWTWSPKYNMDDSAKRQPWVWPIKDTTYRIIIADSSGCGAPDTAFKKILVRDYPTSRLQFNDTAICGNSVLKIPYAFQGGDSNYSWQWFFVFSKTSWFPSVKGNSKHTDTLTYSPNEPKEILALVLKDGCTNKPDTAYLTISQRKPVVISNKFGDTTVCNGQTLNYKVIATGGLAKSYQYQWKDQNSNYLLSSADSLKIKTAKTLRIQLIVNDGCEALGDTAEFMITVKPPLKVSTNLRDTTICYGQKINYTATAQGGDAKAYKFNWVLNNKLIDSTSTFILTSALTSTLSLILKDNCTIPNDTVRKTITVKPSPKADFSYDLACSKTITKFQFTRTKPNAPITTSFRWNFNNEVTSSLENPSHKFVNVGTSTTTLILASDNGCTDTLKKTIIIKPQSKADFTANDVCETDSAVFINKSQDATSYYWRFGDGQTSNLQTPKHKYHITSTTTYNVSLVALVANGCSDSIGKAISINSNPNSNFTHTLTGTKVDLKATVQGNTKYQWKFGSTDSATTTNGNYTFNLTKPEHYKICLKVTNLAGCISQTCKDITVGISQTPKPSGFKIYPNPNNGNFTVEIENPASDVSIEVYNLVGELVKKVERAGKVTTVDLNVEAGIYLVSVKNGGVVWNKKIRVF